MKLVCIRTKNELFLSDDDQDFLEALIRRLDLEQTFPYFMTDDFGLVDCLEISTWITNHITENKIFETIIGDKILPVIIDDNLSKPVNYQPLSLDKLRFLSEFSNFMNSCRYGATIE